MSKSAMVVEQEAAHQSVPAPAPYRIIDDVGGAFAMGAIGGSAYHALKGARNAPKRQRCRGAYSAVVQRGSQVGGGFANWGGLFAVYGCAFEAMRQKEDPFNAVMAGAATGGTLAARQGLGAIAKSAAIGGCLLALIEGGIVLFSKLTKPSAEQDSALKMLPSPFQQAVMNNQSTTLPGGAATASSIAGIPSPDSAAVLASNRPRLSPREEHELHQKSIAAAQVAQQSAFAAQSARLSEFSADDFTFDTSQDLRLEL